MLRLIQRQPPPPRTRSPISTAMPSRIPLSLVFLALCAAPLRAEEAPAPPAADILKEARLTASLQQGDLDGNLECNDTKIPFRLSMAEGKLSFAFKAPDEQFTLDLGDEAFRFSETRDGKSNPMALDKYARQIRNTDVTYEDIALRFLFWPSAQVLGTDRFKDRPAWKLRINNPRNEGLYAVVYAWIDKETSALMKVQGYNWKGRCVKQFEVTDVMKVGDNWMLKAMRVETLDGNDKVASRTYLRLDKPADKPTGRRPGWE